MCKICGYSKCNGDGTAPFEILAEMRLEEKPLPNIAKDLKRLHIALAHLRAAPDWVRETTQETMTLSCGLTVQVLDGPPRFKVLLKEEDKMQSTLMQFLNRCHPSRAKDMCTCCGKLIPESFKEAFCTCGLVNYCSSECQKKDWRTGGHKQVHTAIQEMRNAGLNELTEDAKAIINSEEHEYEVK